MLNDGTYKVFFNASACDKIKSQEERAFFKFLTGNNADTKFTKRLSEKLLLARKNLEWRTQFMTFREQFCEELDEARAEAAKEAREEGKTQGAEDNKLHNAMNALKLGLTPELVSQITELPVEKVQALRQQL